MGIVARAGGLITRTREEWVVTTGEPADTAGLFKNCVIPVSAIPAAAGLVGLVPFAPASAGALPGFSPTASWLAGVFAAFPPLAILGLPGLCTFFISYEGAPAALGLPMDEALVFTLALIACGLRVHLPAGFVASARLVF